MQQTLLRTAALKPYCSTVARRDWYEGLIASCWPNSIPHWRVWKPTESVIDAAKPETRREHKEKLLLACAYSRVRPVSNVNVEPRAERRKVAAPVAYCRAARIQLVKVLKFFIKTREPGHARRCYSSRCHLNASRGSERSLLSTIITGSSSLSAGGGEKSPVTSPAYMRLVHR